MTTTEHEAHRVDWTGPNGRDGYLIYIEQAKPLGQIQKIEQDGVYLGHAVLDARETAHMLAERKRETGHTATVTQTVVLIDNGKEN